MVLSFSFVSAGFSFLFSLLFYFVHVVDGGFVVLVMILSCSPERLLKRWAKPVLILQGSREMSFPVSLARKLHAALPASTLAEIPEAAHMAHFDNSQAWLAAIRSFLSSAQSADQASAHWL